MKKNLLAVTLLASLLFTGTTPLLADELPADSDIEISVPTTEEEILEELEELDTPWEVGSVGEAELGFAGSDEELLIGEAEDASLVGVALENGTNGLPVLNITLNGVTLDEIKAGYKSQKYEGATAEFSGGDAASSYADTTIKGRGNSTWTFPKKPFQIKFSKKQELFGQGKAKTWILLANFMDPSHVRNDASLRLAVQNGIPGALPQGRFIEVCFDGVYEGLYYLTRKVEVGTVPLENDNGIIAEIEHAHIPDDLYVTSDNGSRVMLKETVIDSDDSAEQQAVLDHFMAAYNQLENAARARDWETVQACADVVSFAKYFLLADFSGDQDMFSSSCYMFRDGDDDVIHAGPMWDFDLAYGSIWGSYTPEVTNPLRTWAYLNPEELQNPSGETGWSPLYEYLMNIPEFRELVRSLYASSVRPTLEAIDDYALYRELSIHDAVTKDLDKWRPGTSGSDSARELKAFMNTRLAYFDILYGTPQAAGSICLLKGAYGSKTVRAERAEDGFYVLTGLDGSVLDVQGGRRSSGAKVQWYASYNGSDAQKWLPLENGAIIAKETGLLLTQADDGSFSIRYADIGANGRPVPAQSFFLAATSASISGGTTTAPESIKAGEEIPVPALRLEGITLREGIDYTLETSVAETSVTYTFTGIGEFTGTLIARTIILTDLGIDDSKAYRIRSAINENKLLTIKDGSLAQTANAQIETASPYLEDLWRFERYSDGTYTIRNLRSGKVLDVEGGMRSNGTNIRQYTANGTKAQRFKMNKKEDGSFEIINVNSGKAVDVSGGRIADGTNVQIYTSNGSKAQHWKLEEVGSLPQVSGTYKIVSTLGNADKGLSIANSSKTNSANILIWTAASSQTAVWSVEPAGDGSSTIKSTWSGRALDVAGAGRKPGTNVHQYAAGSGNTAQKWVIVETPDGTCTIYSVCSGLALDITGGRNANGANVQIYTPNGSKAQKWLFKAA